MGVKRNFYMEIKERLKFARESISLIQADFGAPLGLTAANIRDLESGKVKISTLHALAIEKIHGISSKWLLTGDGEMRHGPAQTVSENFYAYGLPATGSYKEIREIVDLLMKEVPEYKSKVLNLLKAKKSLKDALKQLGQNDNEWF